jgi:hypothetical protein
MRGREGLEGLVFPSCPSRLSCLAYWNVYLKLSIIT